MITLIAVAVIIGVVLYLLVNWLALRIVGIKASFRNVSKITLVLLIFQGLLSTPWFITKNSLLDGVLSIISLVGSFVLWCKLLKHYYQVNIGKSVAALIIAYVFSTILAVILAISALGFVQVFKVDGVSMSPTLQQGDAVLVYKFDKNYKLNAVVTYHVDANGKPYTGLGRIHGTPGQTVKTDKGYVNGNYQLVQASEYTLKQNEYYIIGDNHAKALPMIVKSNDIRAIVGPTIIKAK